MKASDLLLMCLRSLVSRRYRTFLTVIGVVIGTASIIMMISLGIGISTQLDEQLKMWGDLSMIEVWGGGLGQTALNDDAVSQMQAIGGVDIATPFARLSINSQIELYAGNRFQYVSRNLNIYGVYPEALEKLGYIIDEGEPLPVGKTKTLPVVFGGSAVYNFEDTRKKFNNTRNEWPDENGVIQEPFFNAMDVPYKLVLPPTEAEDNAKKLEYELTAVGTLVGERNKDETLYSVFMPLEDMQEIISAFNRENGVKVSKKDKPAYDSVKVKAANLDRIPDIEKEIQGMGFGTWSMEGRRQQMQASMLQIQIILGSLGGITLLVSAISIANTMIASVYERTREIGVMKVLGCLVGNIRALFLTEAGLIGLFGGALGVGFSFIISFVLNFLGDAISGLGGGLLGIGIYGGEGSRISIIPAWLVLLGLAFSTGVGLVAGFYPANRAVRISALEAIRQE